MADIEAWLVQLMRLTVFPTAPTRLEDLTWWEDLVGKTPDSDQIKRGIGERLQTGLFDGNQLLLRVQPERIDWMLGPLFKPEEGALPTVGPFPSILEKFRELMGKWIDMSPPIQRLAFGAVLLREAADHSGAYLELQRYLPSVKLDPENSYDFSYSINRPRFVSVGTLDNLKINRLSKWSAVRVAIIREDRPSGAVQRVGEEIFACRLELDMSTDSDYQAELLADCRSELLNRLIEMGHEIAETGDAA